MPLYFAFGSNMDAQQMTRRCPGARSLGPAVLADHHLVFRGPSRNRGGGVLSVDEAPDGQVTGVLYEVTDAHLRALDRFEGAPEWYIRALCSVQEPGGNTREAVLYRLPPHVEEMPPTAAYLQQVAEAFEALSIPSATLDDAVDRATTAG